MVIKHKLSCDDLMLRNVCAWNNRLSIGSFAYLTLQHVARSKFVLLFFFLRVFIRDPYPVSPPSLIVIVPQLSSFVLGNPWSNRVARKSGKARWPGMWQCVYLNCLDDSRTAHVLGQPFHTFNTSLKILTENDGQFNSRKVRVTLLGEEIMIMIKTVCLARFKAARIIKICLK